jgi:hypothetical protein
MKLIKAVAVASVAVLMVGLLTLGIEVDQSDHISRTSNEYILSPGCCKTTEPAFSGLYPEHLQAEKSLLSCSVEKPVGIGEAVACSTFAVLVGLIMLAATCEFGYTPVYPPTKSKSTK